MYTIETDCKSVSKADSRIINNDAEIVQLLTDSRRVIFAETTLFFALL